MHRLMMTALALASVAASCARAADLPPQQAYRAPAEVVAERFTWTGVYVGANAGYGWGTLSNTAGTASSHLNGALAGGQIGGNWQSGALVLGVEGDFQATWQKRSTTFLGVTAAEELPWFGTLRGRAGVAMDRHLFYVTGGVAYADLKFSLSALGTTLSSHDTKAGWVAGGGWEYMFAEHWSAKVEGLYFDTGNTSVTLFGVTLNGRGHDAIARIGVNYHF